MLTDVSFYKSLRVDSLAFLEEHRDNKGKYGAEIAHTESRGKTNKKEN